MDENAAAHLLCALFRGLYPAAPAEGIEPVSYWYNPNIHPYQEYKARRDTLMAHAPSVGVELIVQEDYGLLVLLPRRGRGHRSPLRPLLSPAAGADRPLCG